MSVDAEQSVLQATISKLDLQEQTSTDDTSSQPHVTHYSDKVFSACTGRRTRDITTEFSHAASGLSTGELIKDDFFTLFEAVGALEIMDPKMDSGYLGPGETLEDEYDISEEISPEQAIGVMDSMMCLEVAWHMGHPLSQTLFTSLYIDRLLWPEPVSLEQASFDRQVDHHKDNPILNVVLRSFCLLLIKSCDHVHKTISAEGYYEEEDFVTNLYHRTLLTGSDTETILLLSEQAFEVIESLGSTSPAIRDALLCRLRFRQCFLRAMAVEPEQYSSNGSPAWDQCMTYLPPILNSHQFAVPVPDSFSIKVQRRFASSVPPRPIVDILFDDAYEFFIRLCKDGKESGNILQCHRTSSIFTFLRNFLSRNPQPALYIRSLLQTLIFHSVRLNGKAGEREMLFNDLEELVLPHHILTDRQNCEVELPSDDRFEIWKRMTQCTSSMFDAYHDLLRALCMNRSRARRMLCHLILDWDNMQLDLEDMESELRTYTHEKPVIDGSDAWELPLSSWAFFHKLQQMEWIVQLGFELGIYHIDEWAGMFRYLQTLTEMRQKHIDRIFGFVHHRKWQEHEPLGESIATAYEHTISILEFLSEEASASSSLAQALAKLYSALGLLGLLPKAPERPYSSERFRQALRLRPFVQISFPRLSSPSEPFDQVAEMVENVQGNLLGPSEPNRPNKVQVAKAIALLGEADAHGRAARKSFELITKVDADVAMCVGCEESWRKGIKDIIRAAVVAGVVGMRVKKWAAAGAEPGTLKLGFMDGVADNSAGGVAACWPVPTL